MNRLINLILYIRLLFLERIGKFRKTSIVRKYDLKFVNDCDYFEHFVHDDDWIKVEPKNFGSVSKDHMCVSHPWNIAFYMNHGYLSCRKLTAPIVGIDMLGQPYSREYSGSDMFTKRTFSPGTRISVSIGTVPKPGHWWRVSLFPRLVENEPNEYFEIDIAERFGLTDKLNGITVSVSHTPRSRLQTGIYTILNKVFSTGLKMPHVKIFSSHIYSDRIFPVDRLGKDEFTVECEYTNRSVRIWLNGTLIFLYWKRIEWCDMNLNIEKRLSTHDGLVPMDLIMPDINMYSLEIKEIWSRKITSKKKK